MGTAPAGTLKLRVNCPPESVPLIVPVAGTFSAGLTRVTGPDTVEPVCAAIHVIRSAAPDCGCPIIPDHAPVRSTVGEGEAGVEPPHAPASAAASTRQQIQ